MEKKELFRIMAGAGGGMQRGVKAAKLKKKGGPVLGRPPMAVCCVSWLSRWLKNMVSAL